MLREIQKLRDDLREAEGYEGDSVGEPSFSYYHARVKVIREELYSHPYAIALAERFEQERNSPEALARNQRIIEILKGVTP